MPLNTPVREVLEIILGAKYFYFGVLNSNVHNAWMRTVAGRLEMRYQYSATIVYNNFVWCKPTYSQRRKIESTAKKILAVRKNYPDATLADLYDDLVMPADLRKAHRENDAAVMAAYGFDTKMTEAEIVAALMKMYKDLTA